MPDDARNPASTGIRRQCEIAFSLASLLLVPLENTGPGNGVKGMQPENRPPGKNPGRMGPQNDGSEHPGTD